MEHQRLGNCLRSGTPRTQRNCPDRVHPSLRGRGILVGNVMTTAETYRKRAVECRERAETATDTDVAEQYGVMARVWERMADELEALAHALATDAG